MKIPANARRRGGLILGAAAILGCGVVDSGRGAGSWRVYLALKITEVHYHPADQDTVPGDEYEFVEIANTGKAPLDLRGLGFTKGIEFEFPEGATLAAGEKLTLASNTSRFRERYGFTPFGSYDGRLDNAGEKINLKHLSSDEIVASVEYASGGDWPSSPDGGGYSLTLRKSASDYAAASWRASFRLHGTPGEDDASVVLVNEVLTHADLPQRDAIELFNYGEDTARIGGWFLSDDETYPPKFRIPAGTSIPPMGFQVFDERDFNPQPGSLSSFALSEHGEAVWLFADSMGCGTGYCHGFSFGEIENGTTFGRLVNSAGQELFPAQKEASLGKTNAGPRVGPVVIAEIMYHPRNDTDEYLEIVNITRDSMPLFDPLRPANTWNLRGLSFFFPSGITLAPGEAVLVFPEAATEARIRAAYAIDSAVRMFPAAGRLDNAGEALSLLRPGEPYVQEGATDTTLPYILVDRVAYFHRKPWPEEADGQGPALARKDLRAYGDDPANWAAAPPSPGRASSP